MTTTFESDEVQALLLDASPALSCSLYIFVEAGPGFSSWLQRALAAGAIRDHKRSQFRWGTSPLASAEFWNLNVAFTYRGLDRAGYTYVSRATRKDATAHPDAFESGMAERQGAAWSAVPTRSTPVDWPGCSGDPNTIDALLCITARSAVEMEAALLSLFNTTEQPEAGAGFDGGRIVHTVAGSRLDGSSHFGFQDGISQPYVERVHDGGDPQNNLLGGGLYDSDRARRQSQRREQSSWRPVRLGEFLLGYPDEGVASTASVKGWQYDGPLILDARSRPVQRNGTFVVFRQLEEEVSALAQWLDRNARPFARHLARQGRYTDRVPSEVEVVAELMAALIGRYPHRVPMIHGTEIRWRDLPNVRRGRSGVRAGDPITDTLDAGSRSADDDRPPSNWFRYDDNDSDGRQCPFGAHVRRANPRDGLGSSTLTARHRIIRHSFSYGSRQYCCDDTSSRGLAFVGVCSNLEAQFEFVKREWFNAGHTLHCGADVDPVAGDFDVGDQKFVIQDTVSPFVTTLGSRAFVHASYGDYFFAPSLPMLRAIAAAGSGTRAFGGTAAAS